MHWFSYISRKVLKLSMTDWRLVYIHLTIQVTIFTYIKKSGKHLEILSKANFHFYWRSISDMCWLLAILKWLKKAEDLPAHTLCFMRLTTPIKTNWALINKWLNAISFVNQWRIKTVNLNVYWHILPVLPCLSVDN